MSPYLSHFTLGIIKIILAEAVIFVLLFDWLRGDKQPKAELGQKKHHRLNHWLAVLAGLSVLAFMNFGFLHHGQGADRILHYHEQYHFYLGAKYLPEVGYTDLYKATLIAVRENDAGLDNVSYVRDLTNFKMLRNSQVLAEANRIHTLFSTERWEEFRQDIRQFASYPLDLKAVLSDHGNTGSPAWAMPANFLANLFDSNQVGLVMLALLDPILLIMLFWQIYRTFGRRVGLITLIVFSLMPVVFDYLGGSFLRFDWLVALGFSFCFYERKQYALSGLSLAYAITSRVFPIFFAFALFIKALVTWQQKKTLPMHYRRFFLSLIISLGLMIGASSLYFQSTSLWQGYLDRIQVTYEEHFYPGNYSYKMVFLQLADRGIVNLIRDGFLPDNLSAADPAVEPADYPLTYYGSLLLILGAFIYTIRQRDDIYAFGLGTLLVYFFVVVNAYYFSLLLFPALVWMRESENGSRGLAYLIGLLSLLMATYFFQHYDRPELAGYFFSLGLFCLMIWFFATELCLSKKANNH